MKRTTHSYFLRPTHSYFVVMCDLGNLGLEAIVHPEDTRRDVIDQIAHGNYKNIVFIHAVDGLFIEDVTAELKAEAGVTEDEYV